MNRVKIKDIALQISSGLTPNRSNNSFWEKGDFFWLKTEQLGEKYIHETSEKISQTALKETSIKLFPKDTLSIAMYGEGKTRGNVSIIKSEMTTNQACCNIILDSKKAYYEYVYYFLKTQYNKLRSLSSGVRKNLNSNDIKEFEIDLPNLLKEQQEIASILCAIDDKIELNNQINDNLERMAKAIYNYWFVQFDFPDENGKPYKSSGGKMVYNRQLKREIPWGWEVKMLGEYANVKKGELITEDTTTKGNVKVIAAGIDFSYLNGTANRPANTITISASGANAGYINFWSEDIFASDCTTVRGNQDIDTFLILKYLELYQNFIFSQARGSAQPHVYPNDVSSIFYVIPNEKVVSKISNLLHGVYSKKKSVINENQRLTTIRDWLLPMLMNGQVTVN